MTNSILLEEWNTPFGTPPFDLIATADFAPATRQAIAIASENIAHIAQQPEPPTFDNTVVALELASEPLDRITAIMYNLNECETSEELHNTLTDITPEITRFENSVWADTALFARVKTLYDNRLSAGYDSEQEQLLEKYYRNFVRNGVNLDDAKRRQYADNAERLSSLTLNFNHNVINDTNAFTLRIDNPAHLTGLPPSVVDAAREEAARNDFDGWMFTLHAPSYRPFMTYADDRSLREQMWRAYNSRGNRHDDNDNNSTVRDITALRLAQANLLDFSDYASYSLTRTMAQTSDTVTQFLAQLHDVCLPHARHDLDEVADYAHSHGADYELQSWDFAYWSEKLHRERYDFDSEALRPYFRFENVRQGIFDLYGRLYGITFTANNAVSVYHSDTTVYEVRDGERLMGLLYLDMFARPTKRGGAWMTEFRPQTNIHGVERRPLIQVVCNFPRPLPTTPSLLSFDEMKTFMHEMGHAMHGLLSDVRYASVSGTNVRHDFVELPSQLMENWCYEAEFLDGFARHYQSGEPIPRATVDQIRRARNFQAGWLCLRQLLFGTVDMAFHTITTPLPDTATAEDFERAHTTALLPAVEGCCVSTAFTHIFCGGYAAGYYGYKWAEVLVADIFSRFKADGIFNSDTATAFRHEILARAGSEHPAVLFRNFMGRDPDSMALIRSYGFIK